jgi:hypothetical protein
MMEDTLCVILHTLRYDLCFYFRASMPSDLTILSYFVYYKGTVVHTFDGIPAINKGEPAIRTIHFGGLTECGHHRVEDIG